MNTNLTLLLLAALSQAQAQTTTPQERRYTEAGGSVIVVTETPDGRVSVRDIRAAQTAVLRTGKAVQ